MDASSLYNPPKKRQPALNHFECLGVQRALEQAPQPLSCARFRLKSGVVGILVCFRKTGSSMLIAATMASDWATVELAKRTSAGHNFCRGRVRYRPALLSWARGWLASSRVSGPSPIQCLQALRAFQPFSRPCKRKQPRVGPSLLVATRTASQVANGKAHP